MFNKNGCDFGRLYICGNLFLISMLANYKPYLCLLNNDNFHKTYTYNNLFNKYLLNAFYLPGTLLGTEQSRQKFLTSLSLISSMFLLKFFCICQEKDENQGDSAAPGPHNEGLYYSPSLSKKRAVVTQILVTCLYGEGCVKKATAFIKRVQPSCGGSLQGTCRKSLPRFLTPPSFILLLLPSTG